MSADEKKLREEFRELRDELEEAVSTAEESEDVQGDEVETKESEVTLSEITSAMMTSSPISASSVSHGGPLVSGSGWSTSPTIVGGWPTTTTTTMTGVVSPPTVKRKRVRLPADLTEKVLIAFLDPDEEDEKKNVVWAKVLQVKNVDINVSQDPTCESTMVIELSLGDWYGNEDSES